MVVKFTGTESTMVAVRDRAQRGNVTKSRFSVLQDEKAL